MTYVRKTIGTRHKCSDCGRKRYEQDMTAGCRITRFGFREWHCKNCQEDNRKHPYGSQGRENKGEGGDRGPTFKPEGPFCLQEGT